MVVLRWLSVACFGVRVFVMFHLMYVHYTLVRIVVVLGFYVPPTAKVIRRRDLGLKSHPKDWRSPGSNSGPLVYKAGSLTARPRRLHCSDWVAE